MQFSHGVLFGFEFTVLMFGVRFVLDDEHYLLRNNQAARIPSRNNRANVRSWRTPDAPAPSP
jgi:hypothetical protein